MQSNEIMVIKVERIQCLNSIPYGLKKTQVI